jgi:two-component system sensor histidine kinase DesK
MCIREAITNIVKHSHATTCHISFVVSSSVINMTIKDNGQGISNQQLLQLQQGGNGLKGIKERLALIEGNLELTSTFNGGSTLKIAVPLAVKKHD